MATVSKVEFCRSEVSILLCGFDSLHHDVQAQGVLAQHAQLAGVAHLSCVRSLLEHAGAQWALECGHGAVVLQLGECADAQIVGWDQVLHLHEVGRVERQLVGVGSLLGEGLVVLLDLDEGVGLHASEDSC